MHLLINFMYQFRLDLDLVLQHRLLGHLLDWCPELYELDRFPRSLALHYVSWYLLGCRGTFC